MRTLRAMATILAWQRLAWWQHLGLALLLTLKAALIWGWPFVLAGAIEALSRGPDDGMQLLILVLGLSVVALVLNPPLHRWYVWRTAQLVRGLEERLRGEVLARVHHASAEELDRLDSGALHTRVVRDVDQVAGLAMQWWHQHLLLVISVIIVAVTTAWTEPRMVLAYAVILPAAAVLAAWALGRLERHYVRFRGLLERVGAAVADSLRTLPVTRAHGVDGPRLEVLQGGLGRLRRRGLALDGTGAWVDGAIWTAFELVKVGQLGWLAWWCWSGRCSIAEAVLLHGLFAGLVASVGGLVWALPGLQSGCASVLAVRELLDRPLPGRGSRRPALVEGRVSMRAVTYRYPDRVEAAVADIDLDLAPGERLALAGRSGSGKSTLAQLALGLRIAQTGEVRLDGVDVRELDLPAWRRSVAVVAQRVVLANASLRENVVFGSPGIDDAAIRRALEAVALDGLLAGLPAGLDTRLGEDGVALSGGQRQRLSIARALVRDPRLVVLDEANAALDPSTEVQVQAALDRLCAGRTVLTVSHRSSALRHADRIIVLDGGRISATGSWDTVRNLIEEPAGAAA